VNALGVIEAVRNVGGSLVLLASEDKTGLIDLLKWDFVPPMPPRARLCTRERQHPPVAIAQIGFAIDVSEFSAETLLQVTTHIRDKDFPARSRTLYELIERLEQVGVGIEEITENRRDR
jgi:hypothetical protein